MPVDSDRQPPEEAREASSDALMDVEHLLHHGYVEEEFLVGGYCLSFRTLSTAEEKELWACYKNIVLEDQVHFVLDLLAVSLHRVNGRRVAGLVGVRELFWGLPRSLLLGLYRFYRLRLTTRLAKAESAVAEYSESYGSKSLWGAFRATGTIPSPDFDFRNSNVVQHLWFVVNHFKDEAEAQKSEWDRARFVADQICMFLDPKSFRAVAARRDSESTASHQKDHDAEADVLADILEMMPPADRRGFVDGVMEADPQEMGIFLDKMPIGNLESMEEYKGRVCNALTRACEAIEAEESMHTRIMQEKTEEMILGFMREQRAKLALRNLRILLEIMGMAELETADAARIRAEVDMAIAERGSGYTLRRVDDMENYGQIMRCEGLYKHCAFASPERRKELLSQVIGEDLVAQVRVIQPDTDAYLLRKANSDDDIGPRTDSDGPPPQDLGPDTTPPGVPPPPPGPVDIMGERQPADSASGKPELADLIHEMAEQYRDRNPGVEDVANKIEIEEHIVETLGHWEKTAERKVAEEASEENTEQAAREQAKEAREHGLEDNDAVKDRQYSALGRRNDAVDALRQAKRRAGVTPGMDKEAFLENIRRIARGDPGDPPEPPSPPEKRNG